MAQEIKINNRGKKMLSNSISRNNLPAEYLSISKNARIKDWCITKRKWQITRATYSTITWAVQGITYNNNKLLAVMWGKLYSINTTTRAETEIGSVWTTANVNFINYWVYTIILTWVSKPYIYDSNSLFIIWPDTYLSAYLTSGDAPTKVLATWTAVTNGSFAITIDWTARTVSWLNFSTATSMQWVANIIQTAIRTLTSWKEIVEFNAANKFVISSANHTTTSAITVTSATGSGTDISGAWATAFLDMETGRGTVTDKALLNNCPDINPIIGTSFAWFTVIVGNTEATKNIMYISRPIIGTEQWRAFDWTWTNAENAISDSKILWLKSTMNKIFIFSENRVEYIGKDSLQTIWWTASLISTPIGDGWQLASYRAVAAAADKIFYLTKDNTINAINYAEWTVEPSIAILTEDQSFIITKFMKALDEDQSWCYCYFDDNNKEILREMKTLNSLYNDITLVYDLGNKTWTTDTRRLYNDVVIVNNKTYAGSSISASIVEANVWLNDDINPIEFEIQDTDIMLWTIKEKIFQWWQTSGWLNLQTNLEFNSLVDDKIANLSYIRWIDYVTNMAVEEPAEIGWWEIGGTAIGWEMSNTIEDYTQFDKTLDHWNLYMRWKRIKRNIKENTLNSDFYLDYYTIFADVTGNIELSDLF